MVDYVIDEELRLRMERTCGDFPSRVPAIRRVNDGSGLRESDSFAPIDLPGEETRGLAEDLLVRFEDTHLAAKTSEFRSLTTAGQPSFMYSPISA